MPYKENKGKSGVIRVTQNTIKEVCNSHNQSDDYEDNKRTIYRMPLKYVEKILPRISKVKILRSNLTIPKSKSRQFRRYRLYKVPMIL